MIKIAAICLWISGLGLGLICFYGIWSMVRGKGIAYLMGFPTYGNGPLEKIGVHTSTLLLIGFLLVCGLECIAGLGLWRGDKGVAILSFAIIPVEFLILYRFCPPFRTYFPYCQIISLVNRMGILQLIKIRPHIV